MRVRSMLVLSALILFGCAPQSVDDLPSPALVLILSEGGGFCASVSTVDADGTVWSESGCEERSSGFVRREHRVEAAERAELEALMDEALMLPDDGDCMVVSPSGNRYRLRRTGDSAGETLQCDPGVAASVRELANRLATLAEPE